MKDNRTTIDIVTSALNEELCISEFVSRVNKVFEKEKSYSHRITIIDNGSNDSTWLQIVENSKRSGVVRGVKMSRTFSFDAALTCGIDQADRDYLVIMASDLQDPPEVIHDLLREIEKGFDQVVVHVAKREHVPLVRRTLSNVFYRFNYWATDGLVPKNVSDYRIMSRRLYLNVLKLRENHRFMRGLSAWAGFKTSSISIARPHRFAGKSKWLDSKFFAVVATAIRATLAFSIKPLLIVSLITFLLGLISFLSLIPLSFFFLINGVPFGGFGTLIGFAILTFGTIMITLSIISLYLTLIYEETRNRPIYVIETATF